MIYNIYSGRFPSVIWGRGLLVRFEEKWHWACSGTRSSECSSNGAGGSVVIEAYSVSTQGGSDHSARSCKTRGQDESKTMLLWANYKTECEENRAVHRWLLASLWTRILKMSLSSTPPVRLCLFLLHIPSSEYHESNPGNCDIAINSSDIDQAFDQLVQLIEYYSGN